MQPILIYMCGLPGSGKTQYANDYLANEYNAKVISSDSIREELGDINDQSKNQDVFSIMHRRIKALLNEGHNVIYDATNLNRNKRLSFLNEIKKISCRKILVLKLSSFEVCLAQNYARERQVPDEVMCRMYKNFQTPHKLEGWDKIEIIRHPLDLTNHEWNRFTFDKWYDKYKRFSQDNPYHKLSLGNHARKTLEYSLDNYSDDIVLQYACMLHDIGKPGVKTFINAKGEESNIAHYYNHENVGAYDVLFYDLPLSNDELLDVSMLINYHMRPHRAWKDSEKSHNKDMIFLGTDLYNKLIALHECDKKAH